MSSSLCIISFCSSLFAMVCSAACCSMCVSCVVFLNHIPAVCATLNVLLHLLCVYCNRQLLHCRCLIVAWYIYSVGMLESSVFMCVYLSWLVCMLYCAVMLYFIQLAGWCMRRCAYVAIEAPVCLCSGLFFVVEVFFQRGSAVPHMLTTTRRWYVACPSYSFC